MSDARRLLASVFGYDAFRPGQEEIVDAVTAGRDVLAIMPTGGGKSLCYQLPALLRDGVTVVISPLIALMRDQVRTLQETGVDAHALTSGSTEEELEIAFRSLDDNSLKLLYIAPERLANTGTLALLKRAGVSLIAVDEAHCVSEWGHDFRPDYLRIDNLRRQLGVPLAAFTATADADTRTEIGHRLFGGLDHLEFLQGFDRPNIRLAFQSKSTPRKQIIDFAMQRPSQSGIIYCGTRAKTESLARALNEVGLGSAHYHAGMERDDRRLVESRFQREDGLIVVATVAFGMGIDKPDIRWVAHADLPKSIESYYQEIGRAGRDGAPADTLTLFGTDDVRLRRTQIDEGLAPTARRDAEHGRLNALLGLAESISCRRQFLLRYFGESSEPCGNCDVCEEPPDSFDATESVQMALSAVLRTGEWFGASHVIDILTGTLTQKVRSRGHDVLPTFGVGANIDRPSWESILRQMMGRDLLRPDPERRGGLRMTEDAARHLRGEARIVLRREVTRKSSTRGRPKELVAAEDAPMLAALKSKRRELAEAAKVPAYIIFNDRTLIEMAEQRPDSLEAMFRISGVGQKKLRTYGSEFLAVINGSKVREPHPARRNLIGRASGTVYDRLAETQVDLARGETGSGKPMRCSASQLAQIADRRPSSIRALETLIGAQKAERFGAAFLEVLANADRDFD